ncbi:hypothetical protein GCM10027160_17870 [Streptomyces calidiresistens]
MSVLPTPPPLAPPWAGIGAAATGGGGAGPVIGVAAVLLCVVGGLIITALAAPRPGRRKSPRRAGGHGAVGRAPARRRGSGRARSDPRLPEAAGLLAACLAAGASPMAAAASVGAALDGPLATALRRASAELALGGDPDRVWPRLGELPDAARLARALHLADLSGAPVVRTVALLASEHRAREGRAARARVHRAGVLLTLPLGLCFLPAFLLIGVAPVVVGLARTLL